MAQPSIIIGHLVGHYRILEKLPGGSQGNVYRARDESSLDRDVALKVLRTDLIVSPDQIRKEAQEHGKLNHPNLATAFDFGDKEKYGFDFLVTEYIPGCGLDDKLRKGPLPEATILNLGIQLTSGLEAAHHEGVIHRDLKPANVRITSDWRLKIIDFGLAKPPDPSGDVAITDTTTLEPDVAGTLPYMAPEQWLGTCNPRTDVWSAGAVLYEMATGERPFPQTNIDRLREAIHHAEPTRPIALNPEISPSLEAVILRCLQKDPSRRYQTAKEMCDDLSKVGGIREKLIHGLRKYGLGLAAAVLLAVGAVVLTHMWDSRPPVHFVVAVLPIETLGQDPPPNDTRRGVAQIVSTRIGEQSNPKAVQYITPKELGDHGTKTADAAFHQFGADRVLEIGMEESAGTFRLTSSLVNQRGETIGARTVTGDRANLMALEDQLATKAFEILPQVARLEVPAPSNVQASEHPEGYEYYVRGRGDLLDYQKPENIDSAIAHFDKALSKSPNYAPAYAGLGEAYWIGYEAHRGKSWLDLATTNCQKALEADPKLAEGHICLGNVYVDKGRYDVAVDQFQRALAIDSNSAEAFNGLAEAYDKQGNAPAAEETYKKAIAARPQYWAVYNWLGAFYGTRARYADAVPMFEKVIQLTPDNQRGYYNLGAVLVMEGKYDEAVESLNHSIKLRPTMSAYSNLGAAYFWQHRYADAIPAFEKARDLDDQDYQNWGNFADALYWSPNRRPEATAAYKRAIELAQSQVQVNPSDATARAYIAEYSAMVGDKLTATKEIRHALETAPQDSDVMFRAALVYNQLGDRRRTLDYLKNALGANYSRTAIRDTPDFSHLQTDPEFQALGVGK